MLLNTLTSNTKSISLKSVAYGLLFIVLNVEVYSQELPNNVLDVMVSYENNEHWTAIKFLRSSLELEEEGSLKQNQIHQYLQAFYALGGKKDSSKYFLDKVTAYWNGALKDKNLDLYGQSLLGNYFLNRRATLLDSAENYLFNLEDKKLIDYIRYRDSPASRNNGEYDLEAFRSLWEDTNTPEPVKGFIITKHIGHLGFTGQYDSIISLNSTLDRSGYTLFRQNYLLYGAILSNLDIDDDQAAQKYLREYDKVIEENNLDTASRFLNFYYSAKESFFIDTYQYDSALIYAFKALEMAMKNEALGPQVKHSALSEIGSIYMYRGDYENSERYFKEALEILPEEQYLSSRIALLYKMSRTWLEEYEDSQDETRREEILTNVENSLLEMNKIYLILNAPLNEIKFSLVEARFLTIKSKFQSAEKKLKDFLRRAEVENWQGVYLSYTNRARQHLAKLYFAKGQYLLAKKYAEELLNTGVSWNHRDEIRFHRFLASIYAKLGLEQGVLSSLDRIIAIENEEQKNKTDLLLADSNNKREYEAQRLLNEKLSLEQKVRDGQISNLKLIVILALVGLLIITFFLLRNRKLHRDNLNLVQKLKSESHDLSTTNVELEKSIDELISMKKDNQVLLNQLSVHIQKVFEAFKGLGSFVPKLGRLNNEQSKYYDRLVEIVNGEEKHMNSLISMNTIMGDREIDIRRVSIKDLVKRVKANTSVNLHLNQMTIDINFKEDQMFLADGQLIEMVFVSLIEHALKQDLIDNKLDFNIKSQDGLIILFQYSGKHVSDETIKDWLNPKAQDNSSYLSKVTQLMDLMDGSVQYLCQGNLHSITIRLNLIEVLSSDTPYKEIEQSEIDELYNRITDFLVKENGIESPDLSLVSLAEKLSVSSRKISYVINTREKTNFSKFLAKLRVDRALVLLESDDYKYLSIAGIGFKAGFNSRSNFFTSFKEFVGCTPKEYLITQKTKAS